jgi:hypothetical protein
MLLFEDSELRGDLVRGGLLAARDHSAAAAGPIAEEGEVDGDVGGGLCCDAGCDEVRAEARVCAQRAEGEGILAAVQ